MLTRKILIAAAAIASTFAAAGLSAQVMPRGGEKRRFSSDFPVPPAVTYGPSLGIGQAAPYPYSGYYGTPWYIYQSRKYKYPAPVYAEPRLGLQYLYPYSYQFGLQMPPETDEPVVDVARGIYPGSHPWASIEEGEALMRKGLYAEAGRRFARELRDSDTPPEVYLNLAKAFFALGKNADADIVLRQAIETAQDLDFLARERLVDDFPSPEVLKQKLDGLGADAPPLLKGTFLVLAGRGEEGLNVLRGQQEKDPAARKVYLRFLGEAFPPEATPAPAGGTPPAGGSTPGGAQPPAPEKKASGGSSI